MLGIAMKDRDLMDVKIAEFHFVFSEEISHTDSVGRTFQESASVQLVTSPI